MSWADLEVFVVHCGFLGGLPIANCVSKNCFVMKFEVQGSIYDTCCGREFRASCIRALNCLSNMNMR